MNILKLSIIPLDKLEHIQVTQELGRYPDLQLGRQGRGEANGLEGGT